MSGVELEFNMEGFDALEREVKQSLDTNWIPTVNAVSEEMVGKPKSDVLAALKATNFPELIIHDET
ncbi:MAG: hypothetical protein JWO01_1191, partial [Microbacteriaceae bacterium]|nr:hypothetical protein [Microbacteriaceae bacterium]